MKTAFLFPGQGSQAVGMGADLAASSRTASAVFDDADRLLAYKLSTYCFYGPEDKLRQTSITQPALFTVSVAAYKLLSERGIAAQAVAGHSVGEYAALFAAGVFDFQTALTLVARRGELMREAGAAHPGTMAAVLGLEGDVVRQACEESGASGIVDAANYNGGGQVVISGEPEAVAAAGERCMALGAKRVLPIPVSGAFHSRLMEPAVSAMRGYLETATVGEPTLPFIANVTADYVKDPTEIRENLARQIASPVRWEETILRLLSDGFDTFVEVGSGKVLSGLTKRIAPDAVALSVNDSASLELAVAKLGTVGAVTAGGFDAT